MRLTSKISPFIACFAIASTTFAYAGDDISDAAEQCSNKILERYASTTCENLDDIAEVAYQKCQEKWNAVIARSNIYVKPGDSEGMRRYSENFAKLNDESRYYYKRRSLALALELRAIAGLCGPR